MALLPSGDRCPAQFCPVMCRCQRRKAEFQEKVAPILVPFIYGPDYYGYTSTTDFVKLSNGYLYQRNILVRVVDESSSPSRTTPRIASACVLFGAAAAAAAAAAVLFVACCVGTRSVLGVHFPCCLVLTWWWCFVAATRSSGPPRWRVHKRRRF